MESIKFLKDQLHTLFERLPYLQIKYEYRSRLDTHIVHILPTFCFEKDKLYAELQFDLEDRFNELFNEENILFISDNELIKIECPILELGVSNNELIFNLVEPPIIGSYIFEKIAQYKLDTGFNTYYSPPELKEPDKGWKKLKNVLIKKDLDKQHQGLFFI